MRLEQDKIDLVRLITGKEAPDVVGWIDLAKDPKKSPVTVGLGDMDSIYHPAKALLESMAGTEPQATHYILALRQIVRSCEAQDVRDFRGGCEDYLANFGEEKYQDKAA